MRPKYSSPGAEALNCSHFKCAHLLCVAPHGSLLVDGAAFGFAEGVAAGAAADAGGDGVITNKPTLAKTNPSDNVDGVTLTVGLISFGAPYFADAPLGSFP